MPDIPVSLGVELLTAYDAQLRGDAEVAGAEIWDHVGPCGGPYSGTAGS